MLSWSSGAGKLGPACVYPDEGGYCEIQGYAQGGRLELTYGVLASCISGKELQVVGI